MQVVKKDWGEEHWIVNTDKYCGKKLVLKKDHQCSVHAHKVKEETFYIIAGKLLLEVGDEKRIMMPGDVQHLQPGTYHRFTGIEDSEIIEFSTTHFDEDSYRLDFSGKATSRLPLLDRFKTKKILVLGDLILDKYLWGEVHRVSPEAPVPVLRVQKETMALGGAANVAHNLAQLSASTYLFGATGQDAARDAMLHHLQAARISTEGLITSSKPTIQKIRAVGRHQQLVRLDYEDTSPLRPEEEAQLVQQALARLPDMDAVIFSDYAKGTLTPALVTAVIREARAQKKLVLVDPKPATLPAYEGATHFKLNLQEAQEITHLASIKEIGRALVDRFHASFIITQGQDGMTLFEPGREMVSLPTSAQEVFDVSGAGDTVLATLAVALASGASLKEAAVYANYAAGIVVGKAGTVPITFSELETALGREKKKILAFEELQHVCEDLRRKNKTVVWTNGCFDLVHLGHIRYLQEAKKLGDVLILGLNADASVKELKGPQRPIIAEGIRAEIMAAFDFVDYILVFPEKRVTRYLAALQPSIYVKGGDYTSETIDREEKAALEAYGARIRFIPLLEGHSTSQLIEKIRRA